MNIYFSIFKKINKSRRESKNTHNGFSLFELIIYIAIFSGLIIVSTNMFVSLSRGHGQSSAKNEVNSTIRFVTEVLKQDIKNASEIYTPASVGTSNSLGLVRNETMIVYDVLDGELRRKEGDAPAVNLTDIKISAGPPIFTRLENKNLIFNTTNVGIKIEIVFSYKSNSPDWSYSAVLKTMVSPTSDGTLSFVGSPVLANDLIAETGLKTVSVDWSSYSNVYINEGVIVSFESGIHNLGATNLIINNGGKIVALSSSQTGVGATGVTILTTGNIVVSSGGHIDADKQGYLGSPNNKTPVGYGPGGGTYAYWGGGGGSYGGQGGIYATSGAIKASTYGSAGTPSSLGSGGGSSNGNCGALPQGGVGGGSIKLVANNLTNNGIISANAENKEKLGGAGSGGSIWVDVNNLTGINSGVFSANGGNLIFIQGADERCTGSGGGGGRISLNSSGTDTYAGSILVAGGNGMQGGEVGTLVRNVSVPGDIIIASGVVTWTTGIHVFKNLTVNQGAVLTTGAAQGRSRGSSFVFVIGAGLGGGRSTNYFGASGAGHGGVGGAGQSNGGLAGGIIYDSNGLQVIEPTDFGSGGGGSAAVSTLGGYGGGAIKIITTENFVNNGNINADGGDVNVSGDYGGAGSGGSLWFSVGGVLISNNGVFSAKGGAASLATGQNRGGGAGGRISFSYNSTLLSGHSVTVSGGLGTPISNVTFAGKNGTINGL